MFDRFDRYVSVNATFPDLPLEPALWACLLMRAVNSVYEGEPVVPHIEVEVLDGFKMEDVAIEAMAKQYWTELWRAIRPQAFDSIDPGDEVDPEEPWRTWTDIPGAEMIPWSSPDGATLLISTAHETAHPEAVGILLHYICRKFPREVKSLSVTAVEVITGGFGKPHDQVGFAIAANTNGWQIINTPKICQMLTGEIPASIPVLE